MTDRELLDFAHCYLAEMDYMNPGQPLFIFAHYATSNKRLYIVTTEIEKMRLILFVLI